MTAKPITPRQTFEDLRKFLYEDHNADAISALRALLAERDAAYKRGQEDMWNRAIDACTVLGATHEVKMRDIPSGGYVATYEDTAMALSKLTVKETPDA